MSRSLLIAVAFGFGMIAMQVGSVEAKNIKGQSPAHTVNPLKGLKHQGGTLVSEEGPFGPSSPKPSAPPVWSRFPRSTFKQLLPPFKVTFGGNPPRAPQGNGCDHNGCDHNGCDHNGCDHNGCDHRGCDHDGCDRHHEYRHGRDWMLFGDSCYANSYGKTCSQLDCGSCR
ncbi:MAG TPA: hypothetical protein VHX65_13880 [Pirellulales bacterium]|nr:hypothetical protein [Pirellulales bacterium]